MLLFYHEVGFSATSHENADHIGVEFSLMAFLCGAESDALADKVPHHVQRMRHLQRRFLDEHLLLWLASCVKAVQEQGQGIYTDIATQSLALVLEHRQQLGDDLMLPTSVFALADVPNLLTDEKTSLRDIAHYLLTPAYTGFFLSSDDIKRLGAKFRVPHGFGNRQQILINLLRTAADYDLFEAVFEEFSIIAKNWLQYYENLMLPQAIKTPWMARLSHSITTLSDLRQTAIEANTEI
ncbi:MAG: molecular chaperone TorD family protein [Anaerolineae bacterium]|nr:molecular chaperone TorD family protein [Anaerolineae bacterium]